jgi:hypothetical protein
MAFPLMNVTTAARDAAALVGEHCFESHRGAIRYWKSDSDDTFCIALFGNDGYERGPDSDPDMHARTKACVHNLYAGLANLLPEGSVEFGTDEEGFTWVILAHFCRDEDHDDFQDHDADEDLLVDFWNKIVWKQWESQLSFTHE